MALTDNLKAQVYPVADETEIKNIVDGSVFAGTGTPTLVDEGADKAWSIPAGTLLTATVPTKVLGISADGGGVTIAMRFKRVTTGTDVYMNFAGATSTAGTAGSGVRFTGYDANIYRGRTNASSGEARNTTAVTNGNILTVVYRSATRAGSVSPDQDNGAIWQTRAGRVGTDPEAAAYSNFGMLTIDKVFINCQTGAAWTLLDYAYWDRELTNAEAASVADDYRGVMPSPSSGTTPITFTGTIPNQTFTNGDSVSVDLSTYFSGTQTPFTFANTGTSLSGTGLTLSSAGLLSGTATTGSVTGVVVTGTDADLDTAASNSFNVTVNASSTPVGFTGTVPAITGTAGTAITPADLSTYFAGSLTPFTYSVFSGSLPTGLSLNSSTGVISGTPSGASSGSVVIRATDTGSNTANTNSFAVTISAIVGTITSQPLTRNNGVAVGVVSLTYIDVDNPSTGALVLRKTGVSTNSSSIFTFSDALAVTGTEYRITWLESTGQFGTAFVVAS